MTSSMNETSATTTSEAYLTELCRLAFLHLWSYPNLYRDQGKPASGGNGKELCDLLVIFENHILIFSDKHCDYKTTHKDQSIAWKRWYKSAILKSAEQAVGAKRWLELHANRIFLDKNCTKPFPVQIPREPIIHLILTCRGTALASQTEMGGSGSLIVTNDSLEQCLERPFHIGSFGKENQFFHIFDEVVLTLVLRTLDTISDFRNYLIKRESFFRSRARLVASGEEELLGLYLMTPSTDGNAHDFPNPKPVTSMAIADSGAWDYWVNSEQFQAKKQADQISYCWDKLIEKFSLHILEGTQHFTTERDLSEIELGIRWMARETRFRRRMLATTLIDAMQKTGPGEIRRRYVQPLLRGDPYWVFLVLPQPVFAKYEQYREVRRYALMEACQVVKHLHPDALDVAGIAVEPIAERMSEDFTYLDARNWSPEAEAAAKDLHENIGIFRTGQIAQMHNIHKEYPTVRTDRKTSSTHRAARKKRKR